MDYFVLNCKHLALGVPCECWRFTYNLGLVSALLAFPDHWLDPGRPYHIPLAFKTLYHVVSIYLWVAKQTNTLVSLSERRSILLGLWCFFCLLAWNALAWLVASSAPLIFQGQDPAGTSRGSTPQQHSPPPLLGFLFPPKHSILTQIRYKVGQPALDLSLGPAFLLSDSVTLGRTT